MALIAVLETMNCFNSEQIIICMYKRDFMIKILINIIQTPIHIHMKRKRDISHHMIK